MFTRVERVTLALLGAGIALMLPMLAAGDDSPAQRFDFPPEVVAAEEAAAQGDGNVQAQPAKQQPAKDAPPTAGTAQQGTPVAKPRLPLPRGIANPELRPEELAAVERRKTAAQRMIAELMQNGETDVDKLVSSVVKDTGDTLDHIVINIATQHIYECNCNDEVLHEDKVSTGRPGFDTPPGSYSIHTKSPKAYSQKYTAWMLQWMALTDDGSYGVHGLEGSSYEKHLGHPASHGCIRISRKYAKDLYPRVKVGMPVKIVNDKKLVLPAYQPLSEEQARSLVLDTLSPADPTQLFY